MLPWTNPKAITQMYKTIFYYTLFSLGLRHAWFTGHRLINSANGSKQLLTTEIEINNTHASKIFKMREEEIAICLNFSI